VLIAAGCACNLELAAASVALSNTQPTVQHRRGMQSNDEEGGADDVIAPQISIPTPEPPAPPAELRAGTPPHDGEVLSLLQNDVPRFVGRPGPLLTPVKCYIVREKGATGLLRKGGHVYRLYHEPSDAFLLAARKRMRTTSPSYLVSLDEFTTSRTAASYYGKINVCY
jgi:Tub family